ncbi:CLIP domain-containing serine protease B4-like isoform X2 [Ochlerotatus camptorhynchus]|uniref:CLIP domain-containing serine protease B4-like isoform X2 n=1 Tax=Ochlerotatus camptorhynchus TaxID=644619 RepID=UPI0031CF0480
MIRKLISILACIAGALSLHATRKNASIWNEYSLPMPGICGVSLSDRIRGGEKTAINGYPWAAVLGVKYRNREPNFMCGGSLISDRFVLTAGHCLRRFLSGERELMVRLGEWDIASENDCVDGHCSDKPIDYDVDTFLQHEDYTSNPTHNDIALVKLARQVKFTEFVSPVCLPVTEVLKSKSEAGRMFTIVGWGTTEVGIEEPGYYASRFKLEVDMPGVDWDTCYKRNPRLWDSELCAGNDTEKQTCAGDSGGGLTITEKDGYWYQYGIISYGFGCGTVDFKVFVRVVSFLPWIKDNIKKLSGDG